MSVPGRTRPPVWIEFRVSAFDEGYSCTCQDVTEVVAREERYRTLLAEEAHQRGRIETASGVLHDLGNALTGIGSRAVDARSRFVDLSVVRTLERVVGLLQPHGDALDVVLGPGRGKALAELLATITTNLERNQIEGTASLDKLTTYLAHAQEVLNIQRAYATAGSDATKGRCDVARVLSDVAMLTAESLAKRRAHISVDVRGSIGPVRVDRTKLLQVLLNLVKNAAEALDLALPIAAPSVVLSAVRAGDGGLTIDVADSGPGFAPERAEEFFAEGVSTKGRGSGVGLAACRRVVESLGGRIALTSNGPGTGATARIELPREVFPDDVR